MWPGLSREETIVLAVPSSEVIKKLQRATKPPHLSQRENKNEFFFNGSVRGEDFEISRIIPQPETYLPLVSGKVEPTSMGCIIFIKYRLFFGTTLFFSFSSWFSISLATFLLSYAHEHTYALLTYSLSIINYVVALANFNLQVNKSKALLNHLLAS